MLVPFEGTYRFFIVIGHVEVEAVLAFFLEHFVGFWQGDAEACLDAQDVQNEGMQFCLDERSLGIGSKRQR